MDRMFGGSRGKGAWLALLIAAAALGVSGAAAPRATAHRAVGRADALRASLAQNGALTVMSYNVEGLPAPARFGRSASLERIGSRLAGLRLEGRQPNVVLLQEAFAAEAGRIASRAGYRYAVDGPMADEVNRQPAPAGAAMLVDQASHLKGEDDGKWLGSGLRILSDYPITKVERLAFPAWACAGYDCLANKGALVVWVNVPGAAGPVAFIDTHLNSRVASGVAKARADMAYAYQVDALRQFIADNVPPGAVAFLGGDFNSGKAAIRREDLGLGLLPDARNSLLEALSDEREVSVQDSSDTQAILERGKDWLFYRGSWRCRVALTGFDVPFGRAPDGTSLSDHLGYEARYRLSDRPTQRAGAV